MTVGGLNTPAYSNGNSDVADGGPSEDRRRGINLDGFCSQLSQQWPLFHKSVSVTMHV